MGLLFSLGKHRISRVNTAFHANFTGTLQYFALRIFGGVSGPPVAKLSSRFLWALIHINLWHELLGAANFQTV